MKVLAIIQAREGSTRFPAKVLKPLAGISVLMRCVAACYRARTVNEIVVATGQRSRNRNIVTLCKKNGVECFVGSNDDVLSRFSKIVEQTNADIIVRITGDCPLIRPHLIDECVQAVISTGAPYCCLDSSFAEGVDVEAFTANILREVNDLYHLPEFREHVTLALHKNRDKYNILKLGNSRDDSDIRITIDYEADFKLVDMLFSKADGILDGMSYDELVCYMRINFSEMLASNAHIKRNEAICTGS